MQGEYVTFSAAWFTLSLINAGLAQGKGRSGAAWWLGSLFAGPFATLLLVLSPTLPQRLSEPAVGRMTRTQAVVIGAGILAVVALLVGLRAVAGS